jgi:hypothetical protein
MEKVGKRATGAFSFKIIFARAPEKLTAALLVSRLDITKLQSLDNAKCLWSWHGLLEFLYYIYYLYSIGWAHTKKDLRRSVTVVKKTR